LRPRDALAPGRAAARRGLVLGRRGRVRPRGRIPPAVRCGRPRRGGPVTARRDWVTVYAAMHRDGATALPPACLHHVLEATRAEAARRGRDVSPADLTAAYRRAARADFGPLAAAVLADWGLVTPTALGEAVTQLGRYGGLDLAEG